MESHRFDLLARRLGAAGSRRQALSAFVAGAVAHLFPGGEIDEAAAGCKGYKGKCKKNKQCCKKGGLRCKKGWKHCPSTGDDCTHVKVDPDNCGACGNECPPATPCCINGSCREMCGGSCCADCFMDFMDGIPQEGTETCCGPGAGTFCSSKKHDKSDDECCWPDQECVKGECCADGKYGSVICGGACCASESCCNGKCCPEGEVCAMTTGVLACVTADRTCNNDDGCLADETCVAGTCCKGDRICKDLGIDFCCPAGEYCDFADPKGKCCAINTQCNSTWRGHRVRK